MALIGRNAWPALVHIAVLTLVISFSWVLSASSQPATLPTLPGPSTDLPKPATQLLGAELAPPRILPPPIAEVSLKPKPALLPKGAHAIFPAFDGDGFFESITRPSADSVAPLPTAQMVFDREAIPFLNAIGFKRPSNRFRIPEHRGVQKPVTNPEALARVLCRSSRTAKQEGAQQICDMLTQKKEATPGVKKSFRGPLGMTSKEFSDTLRRGQREYFFPQIEGTCPEDHPDPVLRAIPRSVPLEHSGIRATGWEGKAIRSVSGRVINTYLVTNIIKLDHQQAVTFGRSALQKILDDKKDLWRVEQTVAPPPELLLIPFGVSMKAHPRCGHPQLTDRVRPGLKYAYRMVLIVTLPEKLGGRGVFYLWLDAETGHILELVPRMGSATADGQTFLLDPGSLDAAGVVAYEDVTFPIDDPSAATEGMYRLQLSGKFHRIELKDGVGSNVERPSTNFRIPVVIDPNYDPSGVRNVACMAPSNPGEAARNREFQEVDLMATLSRYREVFNSGPKLSEFPGKGLDIHYNKTSMGCDAGSDNDGFYFGVCQGATHADCPNVNNPDPVNKPFDADLNPVHDHTVVAHEVGHQLTGIQYKYPGQLPSSPQMPEVIVLDGDVTSSDRPYDWCHGPTVEGRMPPAGVKADPCPKPTDPHIFHDFADAWSQVLENTNCFGGWFGKNRGGIDQSKYCTKHNELNDWPRLSEIGMTFDSSLPLVQDHFPEHRLNAASLNQISSGAMTYSDMQIAGAALWAVRQGLIRLEPVVMGEMLYLVRFIDTLEKAGWLGTLTRITLPSSALVYTDRDVYRSLVELEVKMASQWEPSPAASGSTVNKVAAGFARAGIFMIPWACLDVAPATPCVAPYQSGADAVIDVDKDVVMRSDNPPTFHIWTGPAYRFDGTDTASMANPAPCNTQYKIEISSAPAFPAAVTKTSTGTVTTGCHGAWLPDASEWNAVKGVSGQTSVYYRVTTRNMSMQVPTCPANSISSDVRISTCPASGLFGSFEPPSVLVTPVVDTIPPSAPTNLSISMVSSSQIDISWSASTDNVSVAGFTVVRNGTVTMPITSLQFQDRGLSPSTTYSYTVQAFDAAGNLSAQSASVSASTMPEASGGSDFSARCACLSGL
jgi:Fibronectin type III domain